MLSIKTAGLIDDGRIALLGLFSQLMNRFRRYLLRLFRRKLASALR